MAVNFALAAVERGGCGSRISPMANEELVGADASELIPTHLLPTCFQHLSQLSWDKFVPFRGGCGKDSSADRGSRNYTARVKVSEQF